MSVIEVGVGYLGKLGELCDGCALVEGGFHGLKLSAWKLGLMTILPVKWNGKGIKMTCTRTD